MCGSPVARVQRASIAVKDNINNSFRLSMRLLVVSLSVVWKPPRTRASDSCFEFESQFATKHALRRSQDKTRSFFLIGGPCLCLIQHCLEGSFAPESFVQISFRLLGLDLLGSGGLRDLL